jgi:hypothetical protein
MTPPIRARAAVLALVFGVSAIVLSACMPIAPPSAPAAPFTDASPWYQRLPPAPPIQSGDGYGAHLAWEVQRYYGHASLNTQTYAPTFYTVGPNQPTVVVTVSDCHNRGTIDEVLAAQLSAVPIPDDAVIPPDADASMVIWQPSTDTVWETWKTARVNGQWQACWGGRLDHASRSIGTYEYPYGASATGISLAAGLITLDDLRSGHIRHAVAIALVHTKRGVHSWPANRRDGWSTLDGAIPEGQRLRLDPAVDLSTLPLTPIGRMVAEAMQQYGAFVRDTAGSVAVYAENPLRVMAGGQDDPYTAYYGGKPKYNQLDNIPWNQLQALPLDYGKP